jgi:hypothetical protein
LGHGKRKNRFQAIRVQLECGHEALICTSMYRLSKARRACVIMAADRKGVWCHACHAACKIEKVMRQESYE